MATAVSSVVPNDREVILCDEFRQNLPSLLLDRQLSQEFGPHLRAREHLYALTWPTTVPTGVEAAIDLVREVHEAVGVFSHAAGP